MLKANVLCCGNKVGKGDRRGPWGAGGTGHAPSSLPGVTQDTRQAS